MVILNNRKTGARKILLFVCGALYIVENFFWMLHKANVWTFHVAGLLVKEKKKTTKLIHATAQYNNYKKNLTKPTFSVGQTKEIAEWISSGLVLPRDTVPGLDCGYIQLRIGWKEDFYGGGLYISTHGRLVR